ncbi:MAG: AglZ/HisF2 family acetamidino modification protein [Chloroflexi bacterium]|jgi:cyclase|nr:AglZ/HisF2 family acetamidino modification protein [Chloroflexota bacterium]
MLKTRVIPCLLLKGQGLVKTLQFKDPKYVGDPINAVKIFNEKEVDELILLDIQATVEQRSPQMKLISEIGSECFMPLCYGGGIRTLDDIKEIFGLGVEKVAINTYAVENPYFIGNAAEKFGSQSIVVAIDAKKHSPGKYEVFTHSGKVPTKLDPVEHAKRMEEMGCGEIFLNSIDRDGAMKGYDIELISQVSRTVSIPVIACGGAGELSDFADAVELGGASAVSAGSLFVFHGKHRAVLITYPSDQELKEILQESVPRVE